MNQTCFSKVKIPLWSGCEGKYFCHKMQAIEAALEINRSRCQDGEWHNIVFVL